MSEELQVIPQQAVTPMAMLQMAVQQGADLDKLTKLMDLQERWEKNEARKAFVAAMTQFKMNPPEIRKNKNVFFKGKDGKPDTDYDHATLDHVCDQIIAGLSAVGITHRWTMTQNSGVIRVTCVLTHAAGHSEEGTALESSPDPSGGKNNIQAIGSTVTYLERYTLLGACGIAAKNTDDDGRKSDAKGMPDEQINEFVKRIEAQTTHEGAKGVWQEAAKICGELKDRDAAERLKEATVKHRKFIDSAKKQERAA